MRLVDKPGERPYPFLMNWDEELVTLGLLCPLPVLKARKRLQALGVGKVLCLRADDPAAIVDVPYFCEQAGHRLLQQSADGTILTFLIQKGN